MVYPGEELATETREHMRGGKNSVAVTHIEKALLPESAGVSLAAVQSGKSPSLKA